MSIIYDQKAKNNKSPGPDEMNPLFLKNLAPELAAPLKIVFQKSVDSGELPEEWKKAKITAIFKKGSKCNAGNYRPISLTSIVGKCLEKIVRNKLMNHMKINNLFSDKQYGFITGRSTVLQLITILDV